jgi:hypothetical protein
MMSVIIALAALALLMVAAYRGYSVILFAPIALGAVLLTDPGAVGPAFTGLFMEKMVGFVKLYFPVFTRRGVWQADRAFGFFPFDCRRSNPVIRPSPRYPGDCAGVCS